MCGIFGTSRVLRQENIQNLLQMMAVRGPDGQGAVAREPWTFLHTRLAIFDLSEASSQPMLSPSNEMLTYNGEIFNFEELGGEASDTKFVFDQLSKLDGSLDGLARELNQWNGFFAFGFVNKHQDLTLVRDRFGEKPLFVRVEDSVVEFSSSLTVLRSQMREEDSRMQSEPDVFVNVLSSLSDCLYETGVKNIYELRPGCYICFGQGGRILEQNEWYDLKSDVEKYQERSLDSVLTDAIRIRMRGDRPVALTLSGGVDSTTIASVIKNDDSASRYFSYSSSHPEYDESATVRDLASKLGVDGRLTIVDEKKHLQGISIQEIEDAFYSIGEVYFDPNFAQRTLYKEISQHGFPISVDGHGADELFLGYQWHVPIIVSGLLLQGKFIHSLKLSRYFFNSYPKNYTFLYKAAVFGKQVCRGLLQLGRARTKFGFTLRGQKSLLFVDFFERVLPKLLKNYDSASMSQSVESRSPFLDHRVVAIVISKPLSFFSGEENKIYLRNFLEEKGITVPLKKVGLRSYFWQAVPNVFINDLVEKNYLDLKCRKQEIREILMNMSPSDELQFWQRVSFNILKSTVSLKK